jgi:2-amino-4-hydroxy-6-hydroxymethyldihydropteridine diphosphokinase
LNWNVLGARKVCDDPGPKTVFIAFGSNLGQRRHHIFDAMAKLSEHPDIEILAQSAITETAPVGYQDQGDFLNGALKAQTKLSPMALLKALLFVEQELGRVREFKNGPRVIDLDLLFYGDLILEEETLTIPHPRLHERAFVLDPLCDLAPDFVHPVLQKTLRELRENCG